ncbi:hypothetical protein BT69DRAFT_780624 [Atractiella rhizophila]|nr:hypothetical protein BT69DRAFT_780624 [Atractiella rhizophila]
MGDYGEDLLFTVHLCLLQSTTFSVFYQWVVLWPSSEQRSGEQRRKLQPWIPHLIPYHDNFEPNAMFFVSIAAYRASDGSCR